MRERVEHGEAGRQEFGQGAGRRPGRWADRWVRRWDGRRPAPGPRPVRPAGALVMVRPLEAPRPVRDVVAGPGAERAGAWVDGVGGAGARRAGSGPRLLVRSTVGVARGGPPGPARQPNGNRPPTIIDFVIALAVGFFLWMGSTASLMQARLRRKLPALQVRTLARRAIAVHASTPVSEAVRLAAGAQAGAVVVIDGDDKPHALVSESAVNAIAPNQRPWTTVGEVATRIGAGHIIGVNDTGEEILATLRKNPATEYLVLDANGAVYGVLATADVEEAFRAR